MFLMNRHIVPLRVVALLALTVTTVSCTNTLVAETQAEQPAVSLPASTSNAPPTPSPAPTTTPTAMNPSLERFVEVVDSQHAPAIAGQDGYEYQRVATADFDGDGTDERAVLTANVAVGPDGPLWEDGHTWQVYIEEATGERTYVYVQFVPNGKVEAVTARQDEGHVPTIVVLEQSPHLLNVYEVHYRGSNDGQVVQLAQRLLAPRSGFAVPPRQ